MAPGTVGVCGSMAAGHTRNSDSWREPSRGSRRSSALSAGSGPFIRGPYAAACQRLHGRLVGSTACGPALRNLVGAIGWSSASSRYAGGAAATGRLVRPFHLTTFYPLGGLGSRDHSPQGGRVSGTSCHEVTWLILPVVICLSQRLSHACLSISTLYCETANGSLNQLSFI